jgi:predicted 3-demethylubiquinone-9 3-methyltransferase (glyoxalase superfamily)
VQITPFLWFERDVEEAVAFYRSLFDDAEVSDVRRYQEGWPGPAGEVMTLRLRIAGQELLVLNGGPQPGFQFSPAISFVVHCDTQAEIDRLWEAFSNGGRPDQCGWVTDRYGITWQIVPRALEQMLMDDDDARVDRVMQTMFPMTKLDVAELQAAFEGP